MRRQTGRVAAAVLLTLLASSSFGQVVGFVQSNALRTGVSAPGCSAIGQSGTAPHIQPYTAELKTTTVQVLANGATITRVSTQIRAIDSQHRTFNSQTQSQFSPDQPAFNWANANDPVENTQANWESNSRTARVLKLPPESERHGCWASVSGNTRMNFGPENPNERPAVRVPPEPVVRTAPVNRDPQPKVEDLGTAMIEGVEAHGNRVTTVTPAGRIGNDRDLISTRESWVAPSLGFEVRIVTDDPRGGKSTTELTHLDLSEPPLETFQPPEGSEVTVEELHQVSCEGQTGGMAGTGRIVH
jgi:hypothetical protein